MKHLDALSDAATPGEWSAYDRGIGFEVRGPNGYPVNDGHKDTFSKADAEFIAELVNPWRSGAIGRD